MRWVGLAPLDRRYWYVYFVPDASLHTYSFRRAPSLLQSVAVVTTNVRQYSYRFGERTGQFAFHCEPNGLPESVYLIFLVRARTQLGGASNTAF